MNYYSMDKTSSSRTSLLVKLWRYFWHGFAFSLLMFFALSIIGFVFVALVLFTIIGGAVVAFALMALILSGINASLSSYFWQVEVTGDWTLHLKHGFSLLVAFFIVEIPRLIVGLGYVFLEPSIINYFYVATFIIIATIDGMIAKQIAIIFQRRPEPLMRPSSPQTTDTRTPEGIHKFCPHCKVREPYRLSDVSPTGTAICRKCNSLLLVSSL